ncbi:helix-turn-helix domain-containing protein [Streptomyces sp. NPDC056835]|uniref:helix-turn-helix domain-containing protein n=1 Tax=Streptomyces sp. NPDC056835 TaxID=3345956 RepID=UPI003699976C
MRVEGLDRKRAAEKLTDWYLKENLSIRAIRDRTGRSFGWVHRLLTDSGVKFRTRGGNQRQSQRDA